MLAALAGGLLKKAATAALYAWNESIADGMLAALAGGLFGGLFVLASQ